MYLLLTFSHILEDQIERQNGSYSVLHLAIYCRLSLNTMTLTVTSPAVYTSQGVNITVTGIAQVSYNSCVVYMFCRI